MDLTYIRSRATLSIAHTVPIPAPPHSANMAGRESEMQELATSLQEGDAGARTEEEQLMSTPSREAGQLPP